MLSKDREPETGRDQTRVVAQWHAGGDEAPPWTRRFIAWTAGVLALLTVVGLVALWQFDDRQRRSSLLWLAVLFAVAVALLGRLRGLAALVGLVASIGVLLVFVLPAILEGASPVLVAIVGSSAIAYLALYLAHGLRTMTSVALLGTLAALALTVGLAALFTELAHFTGLASEEAILVTVGTKGIDLQGLVLAGMVARRARRA